jgi:hypothetical protein
VKTLAIILVTAIVTGTSTYFVTGVLARFERNEKYARLLWAHCPQLIVEPDHPERSFIDFKDGSYVPIMPRVSPAGGNPN